VALPKGRSARLVAFDIESHLSAFSPTCFSDLDVGDCSVSSNIIDVKSVPPWIGAFLVSNLDVVLKVAANTTELGFDDAASSRHLLAAGEADEGWSV